MCQKKIAPTVHSTHSTSLFDAQCSLFDKAAELFQVKQRELQMLAVHHLMKGAMLAGLPGLEILAPVVLVTQKFR